MRKYAYRLILFMLLVVAGTKGYATMAPANATIGTQASLVFVDSTNQSKTVLSNIVVVTINPVYTVTISPGITSTASQGEKISIPAKITNNGNIDTTYSLYQANDDTLNNLQFVIDTNENGIIDADETQIILPLGVTPIVKAGESISIIATGNVLANAPIGAQQKYSIHAKVPVNDTVAWNDNIFNIIDVANVQIVKSIGETATHGAFVYLFNITNDSTMVGTNVVLTDTIPASVVPDIDRGVWTPFGQTTGKGILLTDTGYESNSDDVALSVINNVLTFKIKNVPAGAGATGTTGGVLALRVKATANVVGGDVITNTASYTYENGIQTIAKTTNTLSYIFPNRAVTISDGLTASAYAGSEISLPATITNTGDIDEQFSLYLANGDTLENLVFTIDTNNNGIIDLEETQTIAPNGLTPVVNPNGILNVVATGNIPANVTVGSEQKYYIHARIPGNQNIAVWNTNTFTIDELANVKVSKSLGDTGVPGAFVYVFKITNDSTSIGTDVTITDTLSNNITPDLTTGVWYPFGQSTGKGILLTDTGYESNSDDVALSVINNVLTFKIKNVPAGAGITNTTGGYLALRVKPVANTQGGTQIVNTASYTFNNGIEVTAPTNTETVTYTVPEIANVNVVKSIGETATPGAFVYVFKIENTSVYNGTDLEITDTLPSSVVPDIDRGVWTPFGQTTGKSILLTDTGYESNSDDVALSVINNVLVFKVKNIPAGAGATGTTGGYLALRVKPVANTPGGTNITNTASFTYNNGDVIVPSMNTNTVTYTTPIVSLTLEKYQAVDTDNNNIPDADYTKSAMTANPGDVIFYKLVAKNTGNTNATNIVIKDVVADHTAIFYGDGTVSDKGKPSWRIDNGQYSEIESKPVLGGTGEISAVIPVLAPGETAEIYYNVKVNN